MMFDILLGRRFSNKCKHSVKYLKSRIETIRKKKQVMVRFLKKDVADLLASGHDDNAFGRIDALIVEINHVSCYDMIEQYCGCLLEHLSTICKQRECPKEAMEAVATLIFAAARFSDLPELADLRTVFTKRYGTRMEACIGKEFIEKIQKKSFSKVRKLQLMEGIAHEFSVNWSSNMFENKMSNRPAPNHGRAKKHQLVTKENEKPFPTTAMQKHQIQPEEQKDFQTTPTNANIYARDTVEKTLKMTADDLNNTKPDKKANTKPKYNQNEKYRNDSILEGNAFSRSEMIHEGIALSSTEKQPSTEAVYRDFKALINTVPPPYTKSAEGSFDGTITNHGELPHSEACEDVKEFYHNASSRRTLSSQPPYRKPDVNKTPNDSNYVNPHNSKDVVFEEDSKLVPQSQTMTGRETARKNDIHGEVYDEQNLIIKRTPGSRRRHGSRRTIENTKDGGYDKEEEILDKLLMHHSKKDTNNEPRKTRTKMRGAPKEPMADAERVSEQLDEHKRHLINTIPQELTIPAENGVKTRTRAASKQTVRMPLRQPENEKPAVWIAQH